MMLPMTSVVAEGRPKDRSRPPAGVEFGAARGAVGFGGASTIVSSCSRLSRCNWGMCLTAQSLRQTSSGPGVRRSPRRGACPATQVRRRSSHDPRRHDNQHIFSWCTPAPRAVRVRRPSSISDRTARSCSESAIVAPTRDRLTIIDAGHDSIREPHTWLANDFMWPHSDG
jgi:hypothetical protein